MLEKLRFSNISAFFTDVRSELRKVSWPGKSEVYGTTVVVIVAIFFFAIYLGLVDQVLRLGVDGLFRLVR
ncbi:MAG: preprotein translocase subunit SecE [Acidobacteriota bacterium]